MNYSDYERFINNNNVENIIEETLNKEFNYLNIMIVGRTGAGKTTLYKALFGIIDNEDRIGAPSETEIIPRIKPGFPYTIYDTPGLELENTQREKLLKNIRQIIKKGNKSKNINERIHCILYCINNGSHRLHEDEDILIKELTSITSSMQVPVIIVITQSINDDEVEEQKNFLESQNYNIVNIIPVLVREMKIDDDYIIEPYGIDELLTCIFKNLPKHLQNTLQNLQNVGLMSKIEKKIQGLLMSKIAKIINELLLR